MVVCQDSAPFPIEQCSHSTDDTNMIKRTTPMLTGSRASIALIVVGLFCFLNGILASFQGAEKNLYLTTYINTHFITTITLFAGFAHYFSKQGHLWSEVFSLCLNAATIAICAASTIADFYNIYNIGGIERVPPGLLTVKTSTLYVYSFLDIFTSIIAIPLSINILKVLFSSNNNLPTQSKSRPMLAFGTAIVSLASIRLLIYFLETLSVQKGKRVIFTSYTLDEPAWIAMSLMTGVICVMAANGSTLLNYSALCCSGALIWPALFYVWTDYRVLGNVTGHRSMLVTMSLTTTVMEMGTVVATLIYIISQTESSDKVRLDNSLKRALQVISFICLVIAIITLYMDLYATTNKMFYRLYQGNNQKTPFFSFLLSVFVLLTTYSRVSSITIPICFPLAILSANVTLYQMMSYIYLTYHGYFPDIICERFTNEPDCAIEVMESGVQFHLVETLCNFLIFSLCFILIVILIRLCRMSPSQQSFNEYEKKFCRRMENFIRLFGVLMEVGALIMAFYLVIRIASTGVADAHPLMVLYGNIYHFALTLTLVIIPLPQIFSAENLRTYPLTMSCLLCLSISCFVDILSTLDYRGTGDKLPIAWLIHHIVEIFALFCHFGTIFLLVRMQSIGKWNQDDQLADIEFNNPLRASEINSDTGYIQLTAADTD